MLRLLSIVENGVLQDMGLASPGVFSSECFLLLLLLFIPPRLRLS
jgi:hypothetical protein